MKKKTGEKFMPTLSKPITNYSVINDYNSRTKKKRFFSFTISQVLPKAKQRVEKTQKS